MRRCGSTAVSRFSLAGRCIASMVSTAIRKGTMSRIAEVAGVAGEEHHTAGRPHPPLGHLGRPGPIALLLCAALVAWIVTLQRMRGMDAGPGTDLGALGWYLGSWVTMTAAMMLPSEAPTVLVFGAYAGRRAGRRVRGRIPGRLDRLRALRVRALPGHPRGEPPPSWPGTSTGRGSPEPHSRPPACTS